MPRTLELVALVPLEFEGQRHEPGARFTAGVVPGLALARRKQARLVTTRLRRSPQPGTRDAAQRPPAPKPEEAAVPAPAAPALELPPQEAPPTESEPQQPPADRPLPLEIESPDDESEKPKRKQRRYERRDIEAES